MIPKAAIEKAIEGGWRLPQPCEHDGIKFYHTGDTALDPSFWQALGKALGWSDWGYVPMAENFFMLVIRERLTEKFWEELLD
jgi:hypothetical protein